MNEKKLSKTRYINFIHNLTGHTKSFIKNNMTTKERPLDDVFVFTPGTLTYHTCITAYEYNNMEIKTGELNVFEVKDSNLSKESKLYKLHKLKWNGEWRDLNEINYFI